MVMRVKGCSRLYKVSLLCMMICVICTLCIAFTGCGSTSGVPEEMPQTALVITDEGEVTYYLEADFDKDYYDITELEAMVQEDMQEYNAELSEEERAVLESVKLSADGQPLLQLSSKMRQPIADIQAISYFMGQSVRQRQQVWTAV